MLHKYNLYRHTEAQTFYTVLKHNNILKTLLKFREVYKLDSAFKTTQ